MCFCKHEILCNVEEQNPSCFFSISGAATRFMNFVNDGIEFLVDFPSESRNWTVDFVILWYFQLVRKMIQDELDIFAEDHTGMPDFALQSMGMSLYKNSPIIIFGHRNFVVRKT